MPYAEGRIFNDADSHFMETKDWIFQYADPKVRPKLAPMDFEACGGKATEELVSALPSMIERRKQDPAAMARAEANVLERKSWHALGGYDPDERRRALDLLGYNRQLVFTGMAMSHFWGVLGVQRIFDPEVLYGGARAHNRGIAEFCNHDERMRAVGLVPLDVPELAVKEIQTAVREGCAAIWVPATPPPSMSPTHPDMDLRAGGNTAPGPGRPVHQPSRHRHDHPARCFCQKRQDHRHSGPQSRRRRHSESAPRTTWSAITAPRRSCRR